MLKIAGIVMNSQCKADFMMLIVTICWGSSYLFMKMGLQSIQEFNLIALRFGIAFLLSGSLFYRRLMKTDLKTIKCAVILGSILFSVFSFIIVGVKSTSASNAGFLVSLTVIFVPILSAVFLKKKPEKRVVFAVCLAVIGIGLLTLNNQLKVRIGDVFCILGAVFYAIHIVVTAKLTKHVDSIILGILQLGVCGGLGLIVSFIVEVPKFPNNSEAWFSVLALSVLCSAIGFIAQTVAQKYTTPTHTGLIFSLEPVFAAAFAFMFAGELLPIKGYLGAGIVLLGVINAEVDFKKLIFEKRKKTSFEQM
jgi:drug/metabolite transporter (DMT)-like permease